MIPSTHLSLLEALKSSGSREQAWTRFQNRYESIIYHWCTMHQLQPHDAEDVSQTILWKLYQTLPNHEQAAQHSFRSWLRTVVLNAVRDYCRQRSRHPSQQALGGDQAQEVFEFLEDQSATDQLAIEIEEELAPEISRALRLAQSQMTEQTWKVFHELFFEGKSPQHLSEQYELSVGAVYQAKYRALRLISQEYFLSQEDQE